MNAYFDHNEKINTNKRIIEAYFADTTVAPGRLSRALDAVLSFLFACWKLLTGESVVRIAKVCGVALSLVGLVGVIGAIEQGTLALGAGLLIGLALLGIEYLCLRPRHS
jgi:hypothetical protein